MLGKKQMEIEILEAAQEGAKKSVVGQRVRTMMQHPVAAICRTCGWRARRRITPRVRPAGVYRRLTDEMAHHQIRAVTNCPRHLRPSPSVDDGEPHVSSSYYRKGIRRLTRMHGLMLPPRVHRRHGQPHSNQCRCSDIFLISCWSGKLLSVARFGETVVTAPRSIQWLSDVTTARARRA